MESFGKHKVVRKLARGGMADVFLATTQSLSGFEKTVVIKALLPHLAEDPEFVEMFRGEARLAAQLNHPNVVSVFDFDATESSWYLVMEYVDGISLRAFINAEKKKGANISCVSAAKVIADACAGLAYIHDFVDPVTGRHAGIVHRDLSPENLMIDRNGTVKVLDFGVAKMGSNPGHTQSGVIKGKIAYMSPEQLRGERLDGRSDIFALGVVLYELVTGKKPFDATTDVAVMQAILMNPVVPLRKVRVDVPAELETIVLKCLQKDSATRYRTCADLQADLLGWLGKAGSITGVHKQLQEVARALSAGIAATAASPRTQGASASLKSGSSSGLADVATRVSASSGVVAQSGMTKLDSKKTELKSVGGESRSGSHVVLKAQETPSGARRIGVASTAFRPKLPPGVESKFFLSMTTLKGLKLFVESQGRTEEVLARLSEASRAAFEKPEGTRWHPRAVSEEISFALIDVGGEEWLERAYDWLTESSYQGLALPVLQIALTLSGSSPGTLLSRIGYMASLGVKGCEATWTSSSKKEGVLKVVYLEPVSPVMVRAAWRGICSAMGRMVRSKIEYGLFEWSQDFTQFSLPVSWP